MSGLLLDRFWSLNAWQKVVGALDVLPVLTCLPAVHGLPPSSSCHSKSHLASSRSTFLLLLDVWTLKGRRMSWILLWCQHSSAGSVPVGKAPEQVVSVCKVCSFVFVFFLFFFFLLFFLPFYKAVKINDVLILYKFAVQVYFTNKSMKSIPTILTYHLCTNIYKYTLPYAAVRCFFSELTTAFQ